MNVAVEELGACRKKLTIQIPVEDVNAEYQTVIRELRKDVVIPGFRKGKASISTIKRRFRKEIAAKVKENLLESSFKDALVEQDISPIGTPDVDIKGITVAENHPLEYHAEVEFIPPFELSEYKGVEIQKRAPVKDIPEERIQHTLEHLQREHAVNEPIDDEHHVIVKDDSVTVNYSRTLDGEPFGEPVENYTFWLGVDNVPPELANNVFGKQIGEHVEFPVIYPEDYQDQNFAGKTIQYAVDIVNIENVVLPEIDDEFAKDFEEETLEDLKEQIRNDILAQLERDAIAMTKQNLLKKIADSYDFAVPPSLVKAQKKRYPQQEDEELEKRLRAGILLAKIQHEEQIEVTDEEVESQLTQLAMQYQIPVAKMKGILEQQGGLEQIRSDIGETKTLNFLYEHAKFVEEA